MVKSGFGEFGVWLGSTSLVLLDLFRGHAWLLGSSRINKFANGVSTGSAPFWDRCWFSENQSQVGCFAKRETATKKGTNRIGTLARPCCRHVIVGWMSVMCVCGELHRMPRLRTYQARRNRKELAKTVGFAWLNGRGEAEKPSPIGPTTYALCSLL